jgi:uncharacterized protein YjbI with pentapeptide repeats
METKMIGNKIADARRKVNMSQAQLAQVLFISPQAVGKWERGESIPDIITFNRLAEILGVDLNYFSENFPSVEGVPAHAESFVKQQAELSSVTQEKKPSWNMSRENLVDTDFSGLKNLHEKFVYANMQRCLFVGSDLSGLLLKGNNIDGCDFSDSDISNSQIQSSHLANDVFKNCSLRETEFSKSYVEGCDFSGADFTGVKFNYGGFGKNIIADTVWTRTSFIDSQIADVVFEGTLEDCYFENCAFTRVTFQNSTLINTFFKNNKKLKQIKFVDCKTDKLTYAFLKNGKADLTGITLLES